jgi:hypothetical protein
MARTKMFKGKHLQHTTKFINELNSVKNVPVQPFRYYDEVWSYGKYKGINLSNTPISYLKWAYNNMKLTSTAKSIIEKYLN